MTLRLSAVYVTLSARDRRGGGYRSGGHGMARGGHGGGMNRGPGGSGFGGAARPAVRSVVGTYSASGYM